MSVVIVASFTPKPGRRDAVRAAILTAVPQVHGEPGCERYSVQEDEEGEAFRTMVAAVGNDLAGPPAVRLLTPMPTGDPAKGEL